MPLDQIAKGAGDDAVAGRRNPRRQSGRVSKIEHRSDICISTLAEYIEAMAAGWRSPVFKDRRCESRSLRSGKLGAIPPDQKHRHFRRQIRLPVHFAMARQEVAALHHERFQRGQRFEIVHRQEMDVGDSNHS